MTHEHHSYETLCGYLRSLGSAAVGTPWTSAQAQASEPPPPAKTVKFADLDIQTVEGAKVLYHRITLAAHQVCLEIARDPVMREGAQRVH